MHVEVNVSNAKKCAVCEKPLKVGEIVFLTLTGVYYGHSNYRANHISCVKKDLAKDIKQAKKEKNSKMKEMLVDKIDSKLYYLKNIILRKYPTNTNKEIAKKEKKEEQLDNCRETAQKILMKAKRWRQVENICLNKEKYKRLFELTEKYGKPMEKDAEYVIEKIVSGRKIGATADLKWRID
jgi:hypothetical protein